MNNRNSNILDAIPLNRNYSKVSTTNNKAISSSNIKITKKHYLVTTKCSYILTGYVILTNIQTYFRNPNRST